MPARRYFALLATLLLSAGGAHARTQDLAVRRYGVADGLANARVNSVYQDTRGFLWIATWEGLSRFDGERFRIYGSRDGLGALVVNAVREDRAGRLWVGTNGAGVARLEEARDAHPRFTVFAVDSDPQANNVNAILFDGSGAMWCHTDAGVYLARPDAQDPLRLQCMFAGHPDLLLNWSRGALRDRSGRMWFGVGHELVSGSAEGLVRCAAPPMVDPRGLVCLAEDGRGQVVAADSLGLFALRTETLPRSAEDWERLPLALAPGQELREMLLDASGVLWIATTRGLIKYTGEHSPCYGGANGLGDDFVRTVYEDSEGTLWIGTNGAGLTKLAGEAWLSYTRTQGLTDENIQFVVESLDQRIYACTDRGGVFEIREGRATLVAGSDAPPFDDVHKRVAQDAHGRWWVGGDDGLYRTRGSELDLASVERVSTAGLSDTNVAKIDGLGPDGEGGIWVGAPGGAVLRFDAEGRGERVLAAQHGEGTPRVLYDRLRTPWIATSNDVGRVRDGRIETLSPSVGLPETRVRALFEDSRGWLWFGLRTKGVSLLRDSSREPLSFENRSTSDGLASDTVWSICEGRDGAMYFGTGRGLDRIDLATNAVEHLGSLGGAGGEIVNHCRCDSRGDVWVATSSGLARYSPRFERERPQPPPVWISRVRVAGVEQPVGERGVRELVLPDLGANESHLEIEFTGVSFVSERDLKYRWRLDGLDADWRAPTAMHSVDLVQLGANRYRFRVQALGRNSLASAQEASVVFRILPPLWQRWWFVALWSVGLAAIVYALHRTRVARAVAMERVRRQIALDLHDDLGAGLAQIAIQSEVAKREREPAQRLDAIASTARALRESMSDIVWSVDPRKDHVVDLVQRMRQVALDVLQAEGLRVEFRAPQGELLEKQGLAPDRRRHVLLMFKELVTNVARHAQAGAVEIAVELAGARMSLLVRDDGRGFDTEVSHAGHGLDNLRKRAAELGAELAIESQPGEGTRIRVDLPLRGRPRNGRAP